MADRQATIERRGLKRVLRQLACTIEVEGKLYPAVIVDLSVNGLFVRTNVMAPVETSVRVLVRRPGGRLWEIDTAVARETGRLSIPALHRGLGLSIVQAPPDFEEFVADLE